MVMDFYPHDPNDNEWLFWGIVFTASGLIGVLLMIFFGDSPK